MTGHIPTHLNPADLCTKALPSSQKRNGQIGLVLHNLTDYQ